MSVRVRLAYERREGACFVPHVSLASVFTRAAFRAGLALTLTQGFSPHPRMSFGPELPAGVAALREPVDVWLEEAPEGFLARWSAAMPAGFRLLDASFPEEGSPSLGKLCRAAAYWVRARASCGLTPCGLPLCDLAELARAHYGPALLEARPGLDIEGTGRPEWTSLTLADPARNGIGGWVRAMIAEGAVAGWQDLNIVRAEVMLSSAPIPGGSR